MAAGEAGARRTRVRKSQGLAVLEDIGALIGHSHDLQETLESIVEVVAERMGTEVCSLYLFDPKDERLTLWATTGLERAAVGKVQMTVDEGLTGLVHREARAGDGRRCARAPALQVLPGDRRGAVPLVPRRADRRAAHAARRAGRADAPPAPVHAQRAAPAARDRVAGGRHHRAGAARRDLESKEKERQEYRKRMVDAIRRLHAYEKEPDNRASRRQASPGQRRLIGLRRVAGFGMGRAHLCSPR